LGCIIAFAWFFTLNSYGQLNTGKFAVILEIEKMLPIAGFDLEWNALGRGEDRRKYWQLSRVERIIPVIFFCAYILLITFVWITRNCNI
jgi:hypothetical protein